MLVTRMPRRLLSGSFAGPVWRHLREFFAYHGVWAPGVRLLRKLSVRAKVCLVMGILGAPILPLSWEVLVEQQQTVHETSRRMAGVRLASAAFELASDLNNHWIAVDTGAPLPADAGGAHYAELVSASHAAALAGLRVQQDWERERPVVERALTLQSLPAEARGEAVQQALKALIDLHAAAADAAAVDATQDRRLSSLAGLALEDLPELLGEMSRVRALAHQQMATGAQRTAAERHQLTLRLAAAVANAEARHQRAGVRWQQSGGAVGASELLPEVRRYLAEVSRQLLALEPAADGARLMAAYGTAREAGRALRSRVLGEVGEDLAAQNAGAEALRLRVAAALVISVSLALYLLYTFFLVMRGGLVQLNHQMNRMAQGDLSARLSPHGVDEVAATMKAMTASLVRLSDLMASVRHGVSAVTQAAQQVALGNADLSTRHHDNAQSLAAIVDGVQRYSAQLEACGRQVETVVGTVQALRLESARNRKQMHRLRERMASLRGKSREIGEIVTLIDHIAFRTNILALNASVEASKAGESGRGFAVVAQEVRNLALRGADSARRIGDIVARSADDIEMSGALAEETSEALAAADRHVDQIHHAMDDVSALTRSGEQESAEILQQLTRVKSGSEEGLQLVEGLATASDALRSQGERLAHKVGQFRLS